LAFAADSGDLAVGPPEARALDQLVAEAFENHGRFVFEWLRGTRGAEANLILTGREHLDAALARGRGAILVTGHLGNWEVAAHELSRAGYPLAVVTKNQLGWLAPAVRRDKERHGIQVVGPGDDRRALYRCLEANRILVLLIDGDGWRRGQTISFLGRPTLIPCGAVRLAQTTGARVMTATMRRTGPLRFHACIHPPLPGLLPTLRADLRADSAADSLSASLSAPRSAGPRARPEDVMRALVRPLEQAIALDPAQWCLFRPLWPAPNAGAGARAGFWRTAWRTA
jgi:lauroyl/myristoyl acyltransferase